MWAAEPKLEERKRLGFNVLIFLSVCALVRLAVKKKIGSRPEVRAGLNAP
jgi:ubiquinol-cytochrome c reductase cytochrome c1 subunit